MLPLIIVGFMMMTLGVALLLLGEVPFLRGQRIPAIRARIVGLVLVAFLPLVWGTGLGVNLLFGDAVPAAAVGWGLFVLAWIAVGAILFRVIVPKRDGRAASASTSAAKRTPYAKKEPVWEPPQFEPEPTPAKKASTKKPSKQKATEPPPEEKDPFDFS